MPNHGKGGRPKGSPNKRTQDFLSVLEKHNFCAASAMIEVYNDARIDYQDTKAQPDTAVKFLKIAGEMVKEISSYAYAKRKAIEATIETTIDPEVLEALELVKDKSEDELLAIVNKQRLLSKK